MFSTGPKNKEGKIINEKSTYNSVTPKYIEITKENIPIKELDGSLKEKIKLNKFNLENKQIKRQKATCDKSNVLKVFNYLNKNQFILTLKDSYLLFCMPIK